MQNMLWYKKKGEAKYARNNEDIADREIVEFFDDKEHIKKDNSINQINK